MYIIAIMYSYVYVYMYIASSYMVKCVVCVAILANLITRACMYACMHANKLYGYLASYIYI